MRSTIIGIAMALLAAGVVGCSNDDATEKMIDDTNDAIARTTYVHTVRWEVPFIKATWSDEEVIDLGEGICDEIEYAGSVDAYAQLLLDQIASGNVPKGMTAKTAGEYVGITVKYLCPELQ